VEEERGARTRELEEHGLGGVKSICSSFLHFTTALKKAVLKLAVMQSCDYRVCSLSIKNNHSSRPVLTASLLPACCYARVPTAVVRVAVDKAACCRR